MWPTTFRIVLATLFLSSSVVAYEDLRPELSPYSGRISNYYPELLVSLLTDAQPENVIARVIVVPSWSSEASIGIFEDRGQYSIFKVVPEHHLHRYENLRQAKKKGQAEYEYAVSVFKLPENPKDVSFDKCTRPIEDEFATTILGVWKAMLYRTRYKQFEQNEVVSHIADGTSYHFGMRVFPHYLAGFASLNPDYKDSRAGRLITIAQLMSKYCKSGQESLRNEIEGVVDELTVELLGLENGS